VRARLAFDQELRQASGKGVRAARRILVPALWGAALVGGTLLALAVVRALRRPPAQRALLRISVEPRRESRSLLLALGGVMARIAMQRALAAPSLQPAAGAERTLSDPAPVAETASLHPGASNGRAKA